jgi:5-oxoprolinase (ATP-hydrolysing) subunit A
MPVTINCDMGEAYGIYRLGDDEGCMPFITHANIACGFHASDPKVMWRTVRLAKKYGVGIGAHPGFPDREGFGRREMRLARDDVAGMIIYQVGALDAFLRVEGVRMTHFKPHGSLFGMAMRDEATANGIADAALALELPVIGFSNCVMEEVFRARRVPYCCEFYADLDYDDRGWQIISMHHDPVAPEAAAARVLRAINEGRTVSVNGKDVAVRADSICVHSDTPTAVAVAKAVHAALEPQLVRGGDLGVRQQAA